MEQGQKDWLRVVYGSAPKPAPKPAPKRRDAQAVTVRQSPTKLNPGAGPAGEQRVRVTVVPTAPSQTWSLYLEDASDARERKVWWRLEPGTWQPLASGRERVAEGRGRVRLDVLLRAAAREDRPRPQLRFVAESG